MQCTPDNFASDFVGANKAFDSSAGCHVFQDDRPMTMALSVLVVIELLNALNRWLHFKRCTLTMLLV